MRNNCSVASYLYAQSSLICNYVAKNNRKADKSLYHCFKLPAKYCVTNEYLLYFNRLKELVHALVLFFQEIILLKQEVRASDGEGLLH